LGTRSKAVVLCLGCDLTNSGPAPACYLQSCCSPQAVGTAAARHAIISSDASLELGKSSRDYHTGRSQHQLKFCVRVQTRIVSLAPSTKAFDIRFSPSTFWSQMIGKLCGPGRYHAHVIGSPFDASSNTGALLTIDRPWLMQDNVLRNDSSGLTLLAWLQSLSAGLPGHATWTSTQGRLPTRLLATTPISPMRG
jgi:hypothetical protein